MGGTLGLFFISTLPYCQSIVKLVIELLCLTNLIINLCVVGFARESLYEFGQ